MNNSIKDKNELKKIKTIFHFSNGKTLEFCSTEDRSMQEQRDIIFQFVNAGNVIIKDCYVNIDKVTHIEWEEFDEPKGRDIDKFGSKLGTFFRYTIGLCLSIYIVIQAIIYLIQLFGDKK